MSFHKSLIMLCTDYKQPTCMMCLNHRFSKHYFVVNLIIVYRHDFGKISSYLQKFSKNLHIISYCFLNHSAAEHKIKQAKLLTKFYGHLQVINLLSCASWCRAFAEYLYLQRFGECQLWFSIKLALHYPFSARVSHLWQWNRKFKQPTDLSCGNGHCGSGK